jgi:DNA-directed RNA polymerase subunit RPC12/RpoP
MYTTGVSPGMKYICAWCNKELKPPDNSNHDENDTSHGICAECRTRIEAQTGLSIVHYIDSFNIPIVLVNDSDSPDYANNKADSMITGEVSGLFATKIGDVYECSHSFKPEGCTRTVHCSGCVIRNTVLDTCKNGTRHDKVPATINVHPDQADSTELLISSWLQDCIVFLKIEIISQ